MALLMEQHSYKHNGIVRQMFGEIYKSHAHAHNIKVDELINIINNHDFVRENINNEYLEESIRKYVEVSNK